METLQPLIEQLTQLIQQAGGQAERVWPDLVAYHWWRSMTTVIGALLFWVATGLGSINVLRRGRVVKDEKVKDWEPYYIIGYALWIVPLFVLLLFLQGEISTLLYPESSLIRSLSR